VAAIIDDGLDWGHQDFGDNLWVNHAEIPNDRIDDDNNGDVNDYQGWNAYDENDNITGGWHGTPVTGIVGAQGNNGIGVAGVNWDVKLMIIQGGGDEADALAAYAYCHTMREIYNNTDGAEGAFVVSTNASWGIDFGQPADAPLWCGFYDIMGQEGIMSCGATINGNVNVDEQGDLPTGCSSDFLISVTNMNDDDVKVTGAGYGSTTIDLGAFGEGTWTAAFGNSYGGFGGTSGATPHVTGTVALMYSVPCPSFTALAKADPGAAALLAKQYILDGVTPNASLDGITVTGGKLNMHSALEAILTNCDPNNCFTPYSLGTDELLDVSVNLLYSVGGQTDLINLQYRELGAADWTDVPNAGEAPYALTGLTPCTEYEFRVQASCSGTATDWSSAKTFKTDGCCEPPSSFSINGITENGALLGWSEVLAADYYEIRYKTLSDVDWTTADVNGTSYALISLLPCTQYEVQIRTHCLDGNMTEFTSSYVFTTMGCGTCVEGGYCESNAASSDFEWIERVEFSGIDNTSGNDGGYGDFTNISTNLLTGTNYDITLMPGFDGGPYDEYFIVWIDYNQNGEFDPATETAYNPGVAATSSITGSISVPASALPGPTRMRVSMQFNSLPNACDQNFDYGEVEDYCVNIITNTNICETPQDVMTDAVTTSTSDISWTAVANATGYEVRYRESGAAGWQMDNTTTPNITLSGLTDCVQHDVEVKAVCGAENSAYSPIMNFLTECETSTHSPEGVNFTLHPNPTDGNVLINAGQGNVLLEIWDTHGRRLQTKESTGITQADLSGYPSGIYFVRITQDGRTGTRKLMKR
jgi:subtilisin family serine protease